MTHLTNHYPTAELTETGIYFPTHKMYVDVLTETTINHQATLVQSRAEGNNILAFYEWELAAHPKLVYATIDRELGKTYNIKLDKTKRPVPTEEELVPFLQEHMMYDIPAGTEWLCLSHKNKIVATLGFQEFENRVVVTHFIERINFHVERAIATLCDLLATNTRKPFFIKLKADHGSLYHKTLVAHQYKFLFLTEPQYLYINGDKFLPANTIDDTHGYTKVYNGGWAIFAPEHQMDNSAILEA